MWAFRNGLLVNCLPIDSKDWITLWLVPILRVNSLACGHTVKFNQKNYTCKEKDKYLTKLGRFLCMCGHIFLFLRSAHILISMFPARIDQGLITTSSCMVSPQQMQDADRGPKRKKPNEKVQGLHRMRKYLCENARFCCTNAFHMSDFNV